MTIKVLYPDRVGYVDSSDLDTLIEKGKIMAFFRANKLVVVGVHKTRSSNVEWHEQERRTGNGNRE